MLTSRLWKAQGTVSIVSGLKLMLIFTSDFWDFQSNWAYLNEPIMIQGAGSGYITAFWYEF